MGSEYPFPDALAEPSTPQEGSFNKTIVHSIITPGHQQIPLWPSTIFNGAGSHRERLLFDSG
jgi:hypothetical protein